MTNVFDGLISRLHTADENISELEDMSTETSKIEKQRKRDWKTKQHSQEL